MNNMKDVAKKAGVSVGTVSNVINNTRYVSPELTKRVLNAVDELNFVINPIASGLKGKRTKTIGLVATNITRVFYSHVINGMQKAANENGYTLSIYSTYNSHDAEKEAIERFRASMIDAIILDTSANISEMDYFVGLSSLKMHDKRIPVMSMEVDLTQYGINSVFVNNMQASELATNHLIEKGCAKIVHIYGPDSSSLSKERLIGYKRAIVNAGYAINNDYIVNGDFSHFSGYNGINQFIKKNLPFDGIFAANDQMAIGACEAVLENGMRIPDDVKVIGFDNTFISSLITPSLTTINVPKDDMGYKAVSEIINILNNDNYPMKSICLETNLIVRHSTDKNVSVMHDSFDW